MGTDTVAARGAAIGGSSERGGDFYLATRGDLELATRGDFLMAMDTKGYFCTTEDASVEEMLWAMARVVVRIQQPVRK